MAKQAKEGGTTGSKFDSSAREWKEAGRQAQHAFNETMEGVKQEAAALNSCLLYTSPSPRDS